jgi:predicted butyrate kinase (DUF1464 family)
MIQTNRHVQLSVTLKQMNACGRILRPISTTGLETKDQRQLQTQDRLLTTLLTPQQVTKVLHVILSRDIILSRDQWILMSHDFFSLLV